MPKGYIVAELNAVHRNAAFLEYSDKVVATLEAYGGRFLARALKPTVVEGNPPADVAVILEFDSQEQAMAWYNSPEYQAILPLRLANSTGRVLCAAGT